MSSHIDIKSDLKVHLKDVLEGVSGLDTPELENFLSEVAQLLIKRKVKSLSKRETELLFSINQRLLPLKDQETYNRLYQKLQDETLSPTDQGILLGLTQIREEKGVKRLEYLVELAQIRKVSLRTLMKDLGIDSISDAT